jgi:hypothetical protein
MGVRGEILRHLIKKQNSLCGAGLLIGGEDREDEGRGEETVSVWRNCLKRCSIQAEDRGRGLARLVMDLGAGLQAWPWLELQTNSWLVSLLATKAIHSLSPNAASAGAALLSWFWTSVLGLQFWPSLAARSPARDRPEP